MRFRIVVALPLVAVTISACGSPSESAVPPTTTLPVDSATVQYVVDGDTVDLLYKGEEVRVRLIGINTPESVDRNKPVQCFGKEASKYTASLLPVGTEVRLERDVEPRDDYGRLLLYVYRASDGAMINLELVRNGYAQPLTIPPNVAYSDLFVEAARTAEANDVGLWSACAG
jgi:micrococcal nuclease